MQSAKRAISEFLHSGNKHTVDIDQETKPAVVHEKVLETQHESVTHAVDREIHQDHHQIHVQPIQDKIIEDEQHHTNIVPVENRTRYHGKDHDINLALAKEQERFKDETTILPTETTSSSQVVVGEHVHHHVHDIVQPVIERERIVPHVVHTTVPIHEHIEHEPYIHKGNVLPTMTMEEFTRAGHSLSGSKLPTEHIDYEGKPLKIDPSSKVGFGESIGSGAAAYTHSQKTRSRSSSLSSSENEQMVPRSMNSGKEPHKSNLMNKLDPRVHSTVESSTV